MDLRQAARAELEKRGIKIEEPHSNPMKEAALIELKKRGISLAEPESSSVGQSLARGAKNVVAGLLDTADFIGTPVRETVNLGSKAIGSNYRMQPMGQMTAETIDRATKGYTASKNKEHKIEEAIQRGGASLLSGTGMGYVASKIPGIVGKTGNILKEANLPTARNIASTAATTGAAQHYLNENPEDELGALAAGFGAGLGTHGLTSLASNTGRQSAKKGIAKSLSINPEKLKDFEKAGVNPTLADVSTGLIPKIAENILGYMPGASGNFGKTRSLQREQILKALHQGEEGLDLSSLSKLTTKGIKNYKGAKEATHKELFSKLEKDIETLKNPRLELNKVHEVASELGKHGLDPKEFARTPVGKFLNKIHADSSKDGIPYYRAKHILDGLNDTITTHGTIGKVTQGRLKHLRNALKDDIEEGLGTKLKELGPESHKNWIEARKSYALFADEDIAHINDLLKSGKKGSTDAFLNLMNNTKKGAEKAHLVLKNLPIKEAHKLVNGITHQLGSYKNEFSPTRWATNFRSLDKPAQDLLLEYLPKGQTKSVQKSIEHLKSTLNEANTSKSTVHQALIDYAKKAAKLAAAAAAGNLAGLGTTFLVLGAGYGASKAMTNQKIIKALAKAAESKSPKNQSAVLTQLIRSTQNRPHHKKGDVIKKPDPNDPIAAVLKNNSRLTGDRGKDLANDIASFQDILKGAKKSFSHMGSNLAQGHVGDAFSDLGNGLITSAQFVANPLSSTVQNVGGALADKYLPSVMSSIMGNNDSQDQDPDYSNYQQYGSTDGSDDSGYDNYNAYKRGGALINRLKKKSRARRLKKADGEEIDPDSEYAPSAEDREAMRKVGITKTGKSKYLIRQQNGVDYTDKNPIYNKATRFGQIHDEAKAKYELAKNDPLAYAQKYGKTFSAANKAKYDAAQGALDAEDKRQNDLYRKGYRDFVVGDPSKSNAAQLDSYLHPQQPNQIWKGDWKSKGYTKDQVLKAYQDSLKQSQQSNPGDPMFKSKIAPGYYNKRTLAAAQRAARLTPDQYAANQDKRMQEINAMKAAQYADTIDSKQRAQIWNSPEMQQYAVDTAQKAFDPYRTQISLAKNALSNELGLNQLQKEEEDSRNRWINEFANADIGRREKEGQGKYLKNDQTAWEALTSVPVLGSLVKGLNTVTGGVIRQGTEAGENFGKGNIGQGFMGLANAGLGAAQFAANPLSSTAQNIGSSVAGEILPKILGPMMPQDQSPGYNQYTDTQYQPNYNQYQSPSYNDNTSPLADEFTGYY